MCSCEVFSFAFLLSFVQSDGSEVTADALDGKKLAVYFSASWCAPCKQFTPILKNVYNQLQKDGEREKKDVLVPLACLCGFVISRAVKVEETRVSPD